MMYCKKFFVFYIIVCVFILSCCITQQELRPQNNTEDIWVCEEPYIFFYWDNKTTDFIGKMFYNSLEKDIVVAMNSGTKMYFFDTEFLSDINKTTEEATLFIASVKYYKDSFLLSLNLEDSQIYTNNHNEIKFVKHNKEEYFKEKQQEE